MPLCDMVKFDTYKPRAEAGNLLPAFLHEIPGGYVDGYQANVTQHPRGVIPCYL